jgi:hypothetical protein
MGKRMERLFWMSVGVCVAGAFLLTSGAARAQTSNSFRLGPADRNDPINKLNEKKPPTSSGEGGSIESADSRPYGGQLYCPVTGNKLGVKRQAVPVQTTIGEKKPGFVAGLLGKKGTPGTVIYVCCPACAEKVRANPQAYLDQVTRDQAILSVRYTYLSAPEQKPNE